MKFSSHQEIELASHFLDIAFSKFKITEVQPIVTISLQSFSLKQMQQIHINCIMDNAYIREACTLTLSRSYSRSRTLTMPISFFSYRYQFNMNQKKSNRQSHSQVRCQLIMLRLLQLMDACYLRKRNMKRQKTSSKKPSTSKAISVTLAIILHFATIR